MARIGTGAGGTNGHEGDPQASAQMLGPFERLEWFRLWHAHCMANQPLLIARSIAAGQSLWLYLVQTKAPHFSSLSNWYSFHFRPVLTGKAQSDATRDAGRDTKRETQLPLLIALARRLKKQAASITMSPVPDADGTSAQITQAFRHAGWVVRQECATVKHSIHLYGRDFAAYWAGRPGELRNTVARKAKKNLVAIRILTGFDADAWAAYEQIYAQSWKTAEGQPHFVRALAETEGAAGRLRLGLATMAGVPVAAQFWTVDGKTAYIHKLAHVEDEQKASPGTLLSHALFQHVIDRDRVETIDFGTGDDAYKAAWMEERETLSSLTLMNPTHPQAWPMLAKYALRRLAGR